MEQYNDKEKALINIERLVLAVFSAYALNICYMGYKGQWDTWAVAIILFGLGASWLAHIMKYKNYGTRSLITTMAISLTIVFYGVYVEDFTEILPTLFVLTGLIGLYGVLELVWVVGIFLMFLVVRQCALLWGHDLDVSAHANLLLQIWNVGFYVLIIYIWVRGRVQNVKQKQIVIDERIAAEKARDDFVANVSHEIRTPLNIIYGNSEIIQGEEDIKKVHEHVNNIAVASRRLIGMVSDILDYSELAYGEVSLEEEVYDITSTVNDVVSMTMAQLESKKLEVLVDIDIKMPKLLVGDEKKIRRIIMNLVSNAIKFTSSGYILIRVGGRRESYGVNLTISVEDSGIGMSDEDIEKLFTKYNQADTKRNRRGDGIGLGISISNLLAQKLGGVLSVRSKVGEGSVFTFVVPQKVVNEIPVVSVQEPEKLAVAYCLDMESDELIKIRDVYSEIIEHMISQFNVAAQFYRSIEDLKRRGTKLNFTHIFISQKQYVEDPVFFDTLAEKTTLIVIMDNILHEIPMSPRIVRISKPFYSLQVAMVFTTAELKKISNVMHHELKFKAPDAKVLVVDDNQMNINVVRNLLKKYDIKVEQALSGAEALDKIGTMDYDFVFMDHMMPEMDGVETTHRIRQKYGAYFQKLPIVALTANAIAGSREMFLSEGFNDFLEKPVEPSVLERVLRRNISVTKQIAIAETEDGLEKNNVTHGHEESKSAKVLSEEGREKQSVASTDGKEQQSVASTESKDKQTGSSTDIRINQTIGQTAESSQQQDKGDGMKEAVPAETTTEEATEEISVWSQIDRESGLLYCGGEEGYAMIMAECVHSYVEMAGELEEALEKKDYPMYVIKIHAIKSTMKSIGALALSEKAKELEFAGKEGRYEEIHEKHPAVAWEYYSLMKGLSVEPMIVEQLEGDFSFEDETKELVKIFQRRAGKTDIFEAKETREPAENLVEEATESTQTPEETQEATEAQKEEISSDNLRDYQSAFENAMYTLDEFVMKDIVDRLENYSYNGKDLGVVAKKMRYKIERNDYFSAGDLLLSIAIEEKGGNV